MRTGLNELIVNKQMAIQKRALKKIDDMLKGDKPFRMERQDPQILIDAVNNLGYMDMMNLRQEFGDDAVNWVIGEAKKLEMRRQK